MKKYFVALIFFLMLFAVASCTTSPGNPHKTEQENLAEELGVKIDDYPYEYSFPLGYFSSTLEAGMTLTEVHSVIQGYEKVLHCRTYREIYYYFSSEDTDALRFEIYYNEQGNFTKLQSEDNNSRTIRPDGCDEGQLKK